MDWNLFDIYDGNEPYLFISYAHADEQVVFPLIADIQKAGYRIWMDRGIEVGTEWSNNIADRLNHCEAVIFFVSKNSIQSENCLDEIACAKSHKKPAILIFLEDDVVMPGGVEMQTARFQQLKWSDFHGDGEALLAEIADAPAIALCRDAGIVQPTKENVRINRLQRVIQDYTRREQIRICISAALSLLTVGLLVFALIVFGIPMLFDAPPTESQCVTAFQSAGYEMEAEWIEDTLVYRGIRCIADRDDTIVIKYITYEDTIVAEEKYNDQLTQMRNKGFNLIDTEINYYCQRAVFDDKTVSMGWCIARHGNVVINLMWWYEDYTTDKSLYDDKPIEVLEKLGF